MRVARERGADYGFLVTSEDDRLAQRLSEAAGFRQTEGDGGPLMLAYERELHSSGTTTGWWQGHPDSEDDPVDLEFSGEIWEWRGPAPYYFVTVPEEQSLDLQSVSTAVTYGWGMIPVLVRIGDTEWETSLWPKGGRYVVPLKDAVRSAEGLGEGDTVTVRLTARTN